MQAQRLGFSNRDARPDEYRAWQLCQCVEQGKQTVSAMGARRRGPQEPKSGSAPVVAGVRSKMDDGPANLAEEVFRKRAAQREACHQDRAPGHRLPDRRFEDLPVAGRQRRTFGRLDETRSPQHGLTQVEGCTQPQRHGRPFARPNPVLEKTRPLANHGGLGVHERPFPEDRRIEPGRELAARVEPQRRREPEDESVVLPVKLQAQRLSPGVDQGGEAAPEQQHRAPLKAVGKGCRERIVRFELQLAGSRVAVRLDLDDLRERGVRPGHAVAREDADAAASAAFRASSQLVERHERPLLRSPGRKRPGPSGAGRA